MLDGELFSSLCTPKHGITRSQPPLGVLGLKIKRPNNTLFKSPRDADVSSLFWTAPGFVTSTCEVMQAVVFFLYLLLLPILYGMSELWFLTLRDVVEMGPQGLRGASSKISACFLSPIYSFLFLDIPTEIVVEVHEGTQGEDAVPSSSEVTHNSHYQQHQTTQFICLPAEGCQTLVTMPQQIKAITSQLLPVFCTQT